MYKNVIMLYVNNEYYLTKLSKLNIAKTFLGPESLK